MKNKILLSFIFMLMGSFAYCQNTSNPGSKSNTLQKEKSLEEKMEGTYLIINNSKKVTQLLTTDALLEIEKKRDDTREIYYEYSQYITIKILPRSIINAPDFDPKKY